VRRIRASLLLLASGLVVYWLVQPEIRLFDLLRIRNPVPFTPSDGEWVLFLRYYVPDAAWCAAAFLMADLLRDKGFPALYPICLLCLPFASEFLQGAGLVPGTQDWVDLSIYTVMFVVFESRRWFRCRNGRSTAQAFSSSPSSP
jgi:hypothetical protein